ncbi:hypothetical protein GV827_14070 [Sulfitobacter sp. JBTF-M27]|uniref:Phage baseplate protein n=1 Tax=Sulfitobacter sediminilitoris TaxID=2698830 RepID=A0A6P0CBD4_9RHOB|nr:hypothetical protein [Sulfitobacter sediminilitoris]NEK23529.1 hypothetical protein [Sulfitobacter sediminilitoris]
MAQIPDSAILDLWDNGACEHPLDRALGLIALVESELSREELAALPIAERDRRLFDVTEAVFGSQLALSATCTLCGAESELTFSVSDIKELGSPNTERRVLRHDGRDYPYRMPNSRDLANALRAPDPQQALILSVLDRTEADDALIAACDAALEAQSGLEALSLGFDCAECGAAEDAPFDILDYLWTRIAAEARRLMWDIHLLARSYGWTSREILSLSPLRRAEHVAMVSA